MKKGILLLSSVAAVATAFAATELEHVATPTSILANDAKLQKIEAKSTEKPSTLIATESVLKNARYNSSAVTTDDEAEELSAGYKRPAGLFFLGLSTDRSGLSTNTVKGGAYTDLTWTNSSTGATSVKWLYLDPEKDYNFANSTAQSITVNYPFASFNAPSITATNGTETETYGPIQISSSNDTSYVTSAEDVIYRLGGQSAVTFTGESSATTLGITTYPRSYYLDAEGYKYSSGLIYSYNTSSTYASYFPSNGTHSNWTNYFTNYNIGTNPKIVAFANQFDAPNSPYAITKVWVWATTVATAATELTLTVYNADDMSVIASGTAAVKSGSTDVLEFDLSVLDEDGFETNDPILIDSKVIFELSGFSGNSAITSVTPVWGVGNVYAVGASSPYTRHSLNKLTYTDSNNVEKTAYYYCPWSYYTDETYSSLIAVTDYCFYTDATFGFCFTDDKDYTFVAPTNGGSKTYNFNCYYSIVKDNISELPDWLTVSLGSYSTTEGTQSIQLTASALPEGVTGRSAEVVISDHAAAPVTITVTQGEVNAVNTVVADAETVGVEYFNMQGQKLAQEPANGFFIKKEIKSNGSIQATKVIK